MGTKVGLLVYLRYLDHVLFKYSNPLQYRPVEREAVGWLVKQNDQAVWILTDRSTTTLKHELNSDSGLIILRSDIRAIQILNQSPCIKYRAAPNYSRRVCASRKGSEKLGPA
jgi:hypothetical protein